MERAETAESREWTNPAEGMGLAGTRELGGWAGSSAEEGEGSTAGSRMYWAATTDSGKDLTAGSGSGIDSVAGSGSVA